MMVPDPNFQPPYTVAIVELDEGPRMLTQLLGDTTDIGDRVAVVWHLRPPLPPLPFFRFLR